MHFHGKKSESGRWHHDVVDAVGAIGRLEPGVAAQVICCALNAGRDAAGRQRGIDRAHGISSVAACGELPAATPAL